MEAVVDTFKRALLKSKSDGTAEEAVQRFLFVCRTTAYPSIHGGISLAEVVMDRKLKTIHSALLPILPNHLSAPNEDLCEGSTVYVRNFRRCLPAWTNGVIQRKKWIPAV